MIRACGLLSRQRVSYGATLRAVQKTRNMRAVSILSSRCSAAVATAAGQWRFRCALLIRFAPAPRFNFPNNPPLIPSRLHNSNLSTCSRLLHAVVLHSSFQMPILTSRLRSPHQRRADNLTILRRTTALPTTSGRFTKTFTSSIIPQFDPTWDSDADTDGPHSQLSSSNLLRELSRKSTSSIPNEGMIVGERVEADGVGDWGEDVGKENWEGKAGTGCFERDRMGSFIRKDVGGKIVADFGVDGVLSRRQLKEILDDDYHLFHNAGGMGSDGDGEGKEKEKEKGEDEKEVGAKEKEVMMEGEEAENENERGNETDANPEKHEGKAEVKQEKKKVAKDGTLRKAKSHPIPALVTSQVSSTSNASACRQSAPTLRTANTVNTFTISRHHDLCTLFILNTASQPMQGKGKHKSMSSIPLFVEQCGQLPTEAWVNGNLHAVHAKSNSNHSDKKVYEPAGCLPWQWWGKVKKKHLRKRKSV